MRKRQPRGSSVAEALVAAALAGLAVAAVASTARLARSGLELARDTSTALALAEAQLELLRAGGLEDAADEVVADAVTFSRAWHAGGGRGRPTRLAVEIAWRDHRLALETGVLR